MAGVYHPHVPPPFPEAVPQKTWGSVNAGSLQPPYARGGLVMKTMVAVIAFVIVTSNGPGGDIKVGVFNESVGRGWIDMIF